MKIGEFARKSGVTVKTLLHYDKIGLLSPADKTDVGYRLYCEEDFLRLQQITTLKFIGFSLDEIKRVLTEEENLEGMVTLQKDALINKKKHIEEVLTILEKAEIKLNKDKSLAADDLIRIIKITNMEIKVKERFNDGSREYFTGRYYWRVKSAELVSEMVNPVKQDIILDLGCGTGKQVIELSQKVRGCIGIDISEGMINEAKKNAVLSGSKNSEFYLGTFEVPDMVTDLKERGITKIISNYSLHHLTTEFKQAAIKKMMEIGGENLKKIVIGDLMFFDAPERYESEFAEIGYGPDVDSPSRVEELIECFQGYNFNIEVYKLHPLVGVLVACKN